MLDGDETRPLDYLEAVVDTGGQHEFALERGGTLDLRLSPVARRNEHGSETAGPEIPVLDVFWRSGTYWWSGCARHRHIKVKATPVREGKGEGLDGRGYEETWEVRLDDIPFERSVFGSLLLDRGRPSRIHLFLNPLPERSAVTAVPAPAWWLRHGSYVVNRIRLGRETRQVILGRSSRSFEFSTVITVSGCLLLLAGSILLLMFSTHWVRTTCWLLLYCALYVSAMDRLVLRLHTAGLSMGENASRTAAVVETATTRLHPVSAARALLATALEDPDDAVRLTALRCLDRPGLRPALSQLPDADDALERLARAEDLDLSSAARRLKRESRE